MSTDTKLTDGFAPDDLRTAPPPREPEMAQPDAPEAAAPERPEPTETDATAALEAEVASLRDQLLRQRAEYQNYRRRTQKELIERAGLGKDTVLAPLLTVLDDFERALNEAEKAGDDSPLREGVALIHTNLAKVLEDAGAEPIEAVGHPFDAGLHEALLSQPAPDGAEEGTVLAEIQRGYRRGDRVLRHARVIVAG